MEKEYTRHEPVVISYSRSSARVVRGEDLDPYVRRRKDAETVDTDTRYIEMFCERYRDRGVAGRVRREAIEQKKKEALHRAETPGSYVMTDALAEASGHGASDAYRSGISDGKRYMTADDFRRYYRDQRSYRYPQYRDVKQTPESREAIRAMVVARENAKGVPSLKKAGWLTDTDKLPAFVRSLLAIKAFAKLNQWAGETFPREKEMVIAAPQKIRKSIPAGLVATLVTVAVSMSMVIGSTVLVSQSTREISQLKEELSVREDAARDLADMLALKSDMLTIEDKAANELGMVNERYLDGGYLDDQSEDYVEVFGEQSEEKNQGLSALLSAFGFGD
ncbi:MAG: hypothetical protein E7645_02735 [Ruminococcaceae bacterium]|nr:hypothetical protein [Oscillospiraceae bacterium]